jgi:hypothetical protein
MPDPRALANLENLKSYRAWQRQGIERWMLAPLLTICCALPLLTMAFTLFEGDARQFVLVGGTVFGLYVVIGLGWLFFAAHRLNAWKRAHPWEPPARRRF